MQHAERNRHRQQQRGDSQHQLHRDHGPEGEHRLLHARRQQRTTRAPGQRQYQRRDRKREQAMVKLRGGRVLEGVAPPRRERAVSGRHHLPAHQWKLVEDSAAAQAGHEATRQDGDGEQRGRAEQRPSPPTRGGHGFSAFSHRTLAQFAVAPHAHGQNAEREPEVRGEAIAAHAHTLDEAALDHVPAQRPLPECQQRQRGETQTHLARNAPLHHEEQPRNGEDQPHRARHVPVEPLPPVDPLELAERDAGVGAAGLRDLLEFRELRHPRRLTGGRQRPRHRFPLRNGESALRQPGDAAHGDSQEDRDDRKQ
jgi:hypothetical protein